MIGELAWRSFDIASAKFEAESMSRRATRNIKLKLRSLSTLAADEIFFVALAAKFEHSCNRHRSINHPRARAVHLARG
jgi:hypothetical protein